MNKSTIKLLEASYDSLERTAEGQLRGGFAFIGGDAVSPLGKDLDCINLNPICTNDGCNAGCDDGIVNGKCVNVSCKPATPAPKNGAGSFGMTFAF